MRHLPRLLLALFVLGAPVARAQDLSPQVADCGLEVPGQTLWTQVPVKPEERPSVPGEPPVVRRVVRTHSPLLHFGAPSARLRTGALSGKVVYVSAGHGFVWTKALGRWATQRGNNYDIVEDLVSTETMAQFLIPMLQNAGAYVVPIRESDLNTQMTIVDDQSPDFAESGPAGTFADSSLDGFGALPATLTNGTNPFSLGGNRLMEAVQSSTPTASATWTLTVPEDGAYNVYVSHSQFSYRVPDAHFAVRHAGGEAHFRINQRRHGSTWVLLGRFYFRAGKDPQRGAVVAFNDTQEPMGNVSLDAVRLGGGGGLVSGNDGGAPQGVSTRPRFEECARYSTQFLGAPTSVYDNASLDDRSDDVSTRSRFAAWEHEAGEDAVYVAWHTNACGSSSCTARGTNTYVYGPNPPDGTYDFTGAAGSDVLAQFVHGELIQDFRSGWDPIEQPAMPWRDRGIKSAYFGELNPTHNNEMPSILMEIAFHNNPDDAAQIKEPYFRYIAARAISQGIIKYFGGASATLPPEPPVALSARSLGDGTVRVDWVAAQVDAADLGGDAASSFVIYQSPDGFAWDDGVEVAAPPFDLVLPEGEVRYFRVGALNAAGESFPSEVAGVRAAGMGATSPALVVNGFGRFDATLAYRENLTAFGLGNVHRVFVERMNDGTYTRRHGFALAQAQVAFDSASAEAVTSGQVTMDAYAVVDWYTGRGADFTRQLPAGALALLQGYAEGGGRLILSGSHLASELSSGTSAQQQFLSQVLGVTSAVPGGTLTFDGIAGEALEGLTGVLLDNGRRGAYPAGNTDILTTGSGVALAQWTGTQDVAAAQATSSGRTALLAFPFETVRNEARRVELMAQLLAALEVPTNPLPYDGGMEPLEDAGTPGPDAGNPDPPDAGTDAGTVPGPPVVLAPYVQGPLSTLEAGGCGCSGGGAAPGFLAALGTCLLLARRRTSGRGA